MVISGKLKDRFDRNHLDDSVQTPLMGRIEEGKEVMQVHYVCSDIHGQYGLYRKLLGEINLNPDDTLYVLGDVIDRGPDSIGILLDMMERDNVELFIGNHELMMLDYLFDGPDRESWFFGNNGGQITYDQYRKLEEYDRRRLLHYLKTAWVQRYVEVDGSIYALHHSYYLPGKGRADVRYCDIEDSSAVFKAVWYSPYRFWEHVDAEDYDDGCIHIIGHVPVQNMKVDKPPLFHETLGDRLINLDGGCALLSFGRPGGLYCMSLEKDSSGERREFWIPG